MKPRTLILRTAGTNCDRETAHAFELAGATAHSIHINRLLESPRLMDQYQILAVPGGFSYGDDINSGRILANQIIHHLAEPMARFIAAEKPIIGICNGFQVLVKTHLLPGGLGGIAGSETQQTCTLAHNDTHRFIDRWVKLKPVSQQCIWTRGLGEMELPIAHGEGRFVTRDEAVRKALWDQGRVAWTYAGENPNGSTDAIAGICDETGLVLGLMPHPERHVHPQQHPAWKKIPNSEEIGAGLSMFKNAVVCVGGSQRAVG